MSPARARLQTWTRAAVDVMADGPRLRTAVVAAAVMAVPPGVAVRAHRRRGKPSERVSVEHETAVGARWVVSRNLSAMIRSGSIVQYTTDDGEVFLDLSARSRRLLTK